METAVTLICNICGPILIIASLIAMYLTLKRWVKREKEIQDWLNDKK